MTLVLALLPGLQFRLHHYVIAMVLVPGTAWPTRASAVYQGFLLGLFLNGVAAWGFDSILQTAAQVSSHPLRVPSNVLMHLQLQRDAALITDTPIFLTNSSTFNAALPLVNQTISWAALPDGEGWDGFALLVDDVERYAGAALNFSLSALTQGIPHFFRIAVSSERDIFLWHRKY